MLWNFYPEKEFEELSVRGSLDWMDDEVELELTVLGADPNQPLRAYGVNGEDHYYLGLLIPGKEEMRLTAKRSCPPCETLLLCIGRMEDDYKIVATGSYPKTSELQVKIDDAPKRKAEPDPALQSVWESLKWERKTNCPQDTELEQFLFSHPSTQANIKFYDHYAVAERNGEILYAFASSFGPHPLPHLAKYTYWHDINLGFGHQGYFILGIKNQNFFLPE